MSADIKVARAKSQHSSLLPFRVMDEVKNSQMADGPEVI